MATAKSNQPPTPPKAGTRPSVRVDEQLAADLAVVMRTGANMSDAIRLSVRQVADMYRTAWTEGVVPVGTAPVLLAYQLHKDPTPPRPSDAVTSGYDARPTPAAPAVAHPAPAVGHPTAPTALPTLPTGTPVGPPAVPVGQQPPPAAPRRRFRSLFRRSGPVPGVPIRYP
ncbi:hypothetical protein SV1_54 [Streptomyces phage SV1]|uniref:hypothetical protein n=1 Tax=Streptomyces phage SV1 TaxID=1204525 RepID=UPI00028B2FF2|nr:hypothetical protein D280_gp54 [Streptomyces phage SV1]AFU62194.1 hypothetical protein SV1_54 [Streptomyces phage SV1]